MLRLTCEDWKRLDVLRVELRLANLSLSGATSRGRVDWVRAFGGSRFDWLDARAVAVWRLLAAGFGVGVIAWDIAEARDQSYWLVYLTHWMLVIHVFVYLLPASACSLAVAGKWYVGDEWKTKSAPHLHRATWMGLILSIPGGFFVCVLNWVLLKGRVTPLSVLAHGGLWAVILFDWLVVGCQPFLLAHSLYFALGGMTYGAWSLIHHFSNLTDPGTGCPCIYSIVNWNTQPAVSGFWAFVNPVVICIPIYVLFWLFNFFPRVQAVYATDPRSVELVATDTV